MSNFELSKFSLLVSYPTNFIEISFKIYKPSKFASKFSRLMTITFCISANF